MTLRRREKILAGVALGLLVVGVGWLLVMVGDSRPTAKLRTERDRLISDVANKQKLLDLAGRDSRRLTEWQRRSLPADPVVARSLYQNWLRGLANRVNFRRLNIESKDVETRRNVFTRISFSVHGHVLLADLATFLYEFYSAGHLHQIRQMEIEPVENARELNVSLTIEALSLAKADAKEQLSTEQGHGLRLEKLSDYREMIGRRNLFAPFVPAYAERSIDSAEYTFVTGFTEVDGRRQVWIQDRVAGRTWRLGEGEEFQVGGVRGTVQRIGPAGQVVVQFDEHRRRLRDGENLRGGVEVGE